MKVRFLAMAVVAMSAWGSALAQSGWTLKTGPVALRFSESATVSVGGAQVPGASLSVKNNNTLGFAVDYNLNDSWGVALAFGVPPETEVRGEGTAAGLGSLGKAHYGPAVLSALHHMKLSEDWTASLGLGVARLIVTETKDGGLSNMKVKDSWGSAVQGSVSYRAGASWGLFVDVKKIWLKTTATGNVAAFGGAPGEARVTMNPTAVFAGVYWKL